jgi:hypothetical protein
MGKEGQENGDDAGGFHYLLLLRAGRRGQFPQLIQFHRRKIIHPDLICRVEAVVSRNIFPMANGYAG